MSITMHTGRPGTGKTYCLTRNLIKYLKKGDIVLANYKLFIDSEHLHYWKHIEDLKKLIRFDGEIMKQADAENRAVIIAMDEAHVYFNSRKWKDLPEDMLRLLAQHRKKGLHIEGTVQHVNRLDVVMRELIDFWYTYTNGYFFFIRWEFDLDQDKQKKFPLSKRWIWKSKKIYGAYDTLETIDIKI